MYKKIDNFFSDSECDSIINGIELYKSNFVNVGHRVDILGGSMWGSLAKNDYNIEQTIQDYLNFTEYKGFWYDLLLERMSKEFGNVRYPKGLPKPGFAKIDINNSNPTLWHYDSEKVGIPYGLSPDFPEYTNLSYFDAVYTFTIMLTDGNFTFDFFPQTDSEWTKSAEEEFTTNICVPHLHLVGEDCGDPNCPLGTNYETIHYKKGTVILQNRRILHRRGFSIYTHTQPRITFQGHGVEKDGVVYLHW